MDSARWQLIQTLFHDAAGRPESERTAFLEAACADDADLMAEVVAMLETDDRPSIVDRGVGEFADQILGPSSAPVPGDFGPYRIREKPLGEGGMGVVYLAEHKVVGNLVAIKVLHAWMSPTRRNRFDNEIRTLGKLKHDYIARIYDADADISAGVLPWFAMEYVEGQNLTDYCRERKCGIEERLRLFRCVCVAVQYLNGAAIIHRDLKPANILIQKDGTPKVLDFGIAKQLDNSAEPAGQISAGMRFMTPPYAAPEQIWGELVGVRTDVYSLGVILYELLSGHLPPDQSKRARDSWREPETPSVVAARMTDALQASKAQWRDLDELCLKAMHTDAGRRYGTVAELIADLDHYLKHEPLKARSPGIGYRTAKFVRRHTTTVIATALASLLFLAMVVFYSYRLAEERDTATRERDAAVAEAARTRRTVQFLKDLFEGGDQEFGPAKDVKVVMVLDRGVKELQSLKRDPPIQAELSETLGTVYQQLGVFDRADSLLGSALALRKSAFGPNNPQVAQSLMSLSSLRFDQSQYAEAEKFARQALDMDRRRLAAGDPAVGRAMFTLGHVVEETGKYPEALKLLTDSVRVLSGADASEADLSDSVSELAKVHFDRGEYPISDSLIQQDMKIRERSHGERHPSVANDLIYLGLSQEEQGHYKAAEPYLREALSIKETWYGKDHPQTANTAGFLAQNLNHQKRYQEAEDLLKPALTTLERAYGKVHESVSTQTAELAYAAEGLGRFDEGIPMEIEALEIDKKLYGENHQRIGVDLNNVGFAYFGAKQYTRAEGSFRDSIALFARIGLPDSVDACSSRIHLSQALVKEGRAREAEAPAVEAYTVMVNQSTPSAYWLGKAREELVEVYDALKMPDKAAKFRAELASGENKNATRPSAK